MKISLISAVAENGVIGRNNELPWHLPDDFAFFKRMIHNHVVIMGRKSFEALQEVLPALNIVVISHNKEYKTHNAINVNTFGKAIETALELENEEIFIAGGSEIYKMAMSVVDTMYITEIHETYNGDAYFPTFNHSEWKEVSRKGHPSDKHHKSSFDFVVYKRLQ